MAEPAVPTLTSLWINRGVPHSMSTHSTMTCTCTVHTHTVHACTHTHVPCTPCAHIHVHTPYLMNTGFLNLGVSQKSEMGVLNKKDCLTVISSKPITRKISH